MARFLISRISQGVIVQFGASLLIFALVRLTGDPASLLLPAQASPEDFARVRAQLGLDRPLYEQYAIFLSRAAVGDFGSSTQLRQPVRDLIGARLPNSLKLGGLVLVCAMAIGVPLGILAAVRRGSAVDAAARGLALLGQSVPSFWLAIVLGAIFAGKLRWLPAARADEVSSYVLPVVTLTVSGFLLSGIIRFVRSGMLEVLGMDYVKLARAKGLPERTVLMRHAFRNASIPLVTFLGFYLTLLLGGASLLVETVFAWPGVGPLLASAVLARDFPVVQAIVILYVLGFVVISIVIDIVYAYLDPTFRFA